MIVSINLSRDRWWGWQQLNNGYKSGYSYKVDGNVKWYCSGTGTYTYRGVSYHRATVGGPATTSATPPTRIGSAAEEAAEARGLGGGRDADQRLRRRRLCQTPRYERAIEHD